MLNLSLIITCCYRTEVVQYGSANTDPATFASGQQLPTRPKNYTSFCNPATLEEKVVNFYLNMMVQCGQIQKIIIVTFQIYNF